MTPEKFPELTKTIDRLQYAISHGIAAGELVEPAAQELIAASGEALGVLKTLEGFKLNQVMYDLARATGMAGTFPEDFDDKATGGL